MFGLWFVVCRFICVSLVGFVTSLVGCVVCLDAGFCLWLAIACDLCVVMVFLLVAFTCFVSCGVGNFGIGIDVILVVYIRRCLIWC